MKINWEAGKKSCLGSCISVAIGFPVLLFIYFALRYFFKWYGEGFAERIGNSVGFIFCF